ncbi:MAG: S8 family serine peptidase [Ardenticatenia bacterium]|nr:S8 family serine peptidase [Ardenticatenia bacterium]
MILLPFKLHRLHARRLFFRLALLLICAVPTVGSGSRVQARPIEPDATLQEVPVCSTAWLRQIRAAQSAAIMGPRLIAAPAADSDYGVVPFHAVPAGKDDALQQNAEPNDPYYRQSQQLNLRRIHVPEAWEITFAMPEVTIAVVADGVDYSHADLVNKLWRNPREVPNNAIDDDANGYVDDVIGWDFGERDTNPTIVHDPADPERFKGAAPTGTVMAGVAAAETHNRFGIAGAAWNARYMPLKTFYPVKDARGNSFLGSKIDLVTEAICYATNNRADVILLSTMSVPRPDDDAVIGDLMQTQEAIDHAWRQGILVVAPGGECGIADAKLRPNCPDAERFGQNRPPFPASLDHVLGVSSLNGLDQTLPHASFGDWIDIAAPGDDIPTTWADHRGFQTKNPIIKVTSAFWPTPSDLAAAHVAAVLALMRSANPGLEPLRLQKALCDNANRRIAGQTFDPPQDGSALRNDHLGCGLVDAEKALENMPWRLMLEPGRAAHPLDADDPSASPSLVLTSRNLNMSAVNLRTGQAWVRFAGLEQPPGQSARFRVSVDGDALRREHGGGLAAGTEVRPTMEAVVDSELYPAASVLSESQRLEIVFRVGKVHRIHLPAVLRAAGLENSGAGQ